MQEVDSHARHIAGLASDLTASGTSVDGVCLPGAKLLGVLTPEQISRQPGTNIPSTRNALLEGKQQNIYRHLDRYIAARSKGPEIVLTTLPHRHDLKPNHAIHDDTVLVNAYIEELAIQHNIRVINFNEAGGISRNTRLLASMIVGGLVLSGSASTSAETHSPPPLLVTAPAVAVSPTILPTPAVTHEIFNPSVVIWEAVLHLEVRTSLRLHKHS
ncbi:hypothetical protein J6590_045169 [Homalodisca vitripennis]|nr:hypothetical protein J6590_045169 [Homalodisca vitripennis]